jgi:hypothetical protein
MTSDASTNTPNAPTVSQENVPGAGQPAATVVGPSVQPDVVEKCEKIVQEYRLGNMDKTTAILELTRAIPNDPDNREPFDRAFRSFCSMLESFERFREGVRGQTAVPIMPGDGQPGHAQEGNNSTLDLRAEVPAAADKRARSSKPEEDAHPSKKRVDISQLPWVASSKATAAILPESLRITQALLENFS